MVIPLIIRGAGMVAKGKNFGGSAKNIAQQGWDVAQTGWQNAPSMVQQGWQKMPGSAKIGAGAGLMGGLAVGGFKGVGKGHDFVKKKIGEKSTLILVFPFLLVLMDYALNKKSGIITPLRMSGINLVIVASPKISINIIIKKIQ